MAYDRTLDHILGRLDATPFRRPCTYPGCDQWAMRHRIDSDTDTPYLFECCNGHAELSQPLWAA